MTIISDISRRRFLVNAAATAAVALPGAASWAAPASSKLEEPLLKRALRAHQRHAARIPKRDYFGVVDFGAPSRIPRFHIVDVGSGAVRTLLVAHGKGSDPGHSGWLERFSNLEGSEASSRGAYVTGEIYNGKHGISRKLAGLDPENSHAEERAIVMHAAWYVSADVIREHGKLGRSQGCFAFAERDLPLVLDRLGAGRMIYADKL